MLNSISIGRYINSSSPLHRMHPLSKIICVIIYILLLFISSAWHMLLFLTIFAILMIMLSNTNIKIYIAAIWSLKYIILFIVLITLILKEPYLEMIMSIVRLILLIIDTTILMVTTTPNDITRGLETLFKPLKLIGLPTSKLALTISLSIRFIPTIINEANKIIKSQTSRGINYYHSDIKNKIIAIKSMIIPIFTLSLKRADTIADVMEIRLYSFNTKRTNYRTLKWGYYDTFILIIHIAILILYIIKEV